jgi:hypothetical protein
MYREAYRVHQQLEGAAGLMVVRIRSLVHYMRVLS